MAAKTVPIPDHITNSDDKTGYYNLVAATAIGDISRSGDNMIISNIKLSKIRSVLSEESWGLVDVLTSDNINMHSYYRSNKSSPHLMGEMAGYNHTAKPAAYYAEKYTEDFERNIQRDGINFKIIIPIKYRRGERLPKSGSASSWSKVKLVANLYEITDPGPPPIVALNPIATATYSSINVTRMYSNTQQDISLQVPNDDETYYLTITSYYADSPDVIIEDTHPSRFVTTVKLNPYSLEVQTPVLYPTTGNYHASFNCKNTAPSGNSETFSGYFKWDLYAYFGVDPGGQDHVIGYSSQYNIAPQDTKAITCNFGYPFPAGYRSDLENILNIYYSEDEIMWTKFYTKTNNDGVDP